MEIVSLVFMILGAGTKDLIDGALGRFVPLPRGAVPAGLGLGLHFFGERFHPLAKAFGTGLLVASAGQLLAAQLARFVPALPVPAPPAAAPLARARGGGGGGYYSSPEEYLKAKYGI